MRQAMQCPRCGSQNIHGHSDSYPSGDDDVDRYNKIEDVGYWCKDCGLMESMFNNRPEFSAFQDRWHDPNWKPPTREEQLLHWQEMQRIYEENDRAETYPQETDNVTSREDRERRVEEAKTLQPWRLASARKLGVEVKYPKGYPESYELMRKVIGAPDDDAPRWEYVRWQAGQEEPKSKAVAAAITAALQFSAALRDDPRADPRAFARPENLWSAVYERERVLRPKVKPADVVVDVSTATRHDGLTAVRMDPGDARELVAALQAQYLIEDVRLFRGFVEHVTMKAHRFLELADELYGHAPIRHLTLTYVKGPKHEDQGLLRALMDSPHLERIRSLQLPNRRIGKPYMRLNELTDTDMEVVAASKRLGRLTYLDLEDAEQLTVAAFDALATSPNLPALSFVASDLYRYHKALGDFGPDQRTLLKSRPQNWRDELEQRHGRRVWLHPEDVYGTERPDLEAVIEYPAALRGHA